MAQLVMYWGYEGVKEPRATPLECCERRHLARTNFKSPNLSRHTCIPISKSRLLYFHHGLKGANPLRICRILTKKAPFMTKFVDIGEDLADIVCDFAYCCRYSAVFYSLRRYLQIKCFKVPKHLMKRRIYSPKYTRVLPSPLIVFEPIQNFGSYRELFDWNTIYMLLWQLDFRRSLVRVMGSRGHWHIRFALDWKNVLEFVVYYRTLISLPRFLQIFKPSLVPFISSGTDGSLLPELV